MKNQLTEHYQLADSCACEHINYLCRMAGTITIAKNAEKAREKFRISFLKRDVDSLKRTLEHYQNAGR